MIARSVRDVLVAVRERYSTQALRPSSWLYWTIRRTAGLHSRELQLATIEHVKAALGVEVITTWACTHTHAEVLAALDRAIETASEEVVG